MISSNIRVPEEIWEKIKKIAETEKRSINSQIVYIMEKYIEEKEKEVNR